MVTWNITTMNLCMNIFIIAIADKYPFYNQYNSIELISTYNSRTYNHQQAVLFSLVPQLSMVAIP